MIIIEKNNTLLPYLTENHNFDGFLKISCINQAMGYWRIVDSDAAAFTYNLGFSAKDDGSDELLIDYQCRLVLTVKIEDVKKDALEILNIIKELYDSMKLFIKANALPYYSKLNLLDYKITNSAIKTMEEDIAGLKDLKRFENKSEVEKSADKIIGNIELNATTNFSN